MITRRIDDESTPLMALATQSQKSCLCIGAANVDIRCALIKPGQAGQSNPAILSEMAGGAALNTARIIATKQCRVKFVGLVGSDAGGHLVARALQQAGVENALITLQNQSTSHYISMLEPDGSLNIACNDMGIHDALTPELLAPHLSMAKLGRTDMVFIDANIPPPTLSWLGEIKPAIAATTVSVAKAARLRPLLGRIDMLFTNKAEAAALLGIAHDQANSEELAGLLARSPLPCGTMSDGENPLWYWQDGIARSVKVASISNIVDVTGAGDALAAGVIAAFLGNAKFSDSVLRGIDMAQKVLRVKGPFAG